MGKREQLAVLFADVVAELSAARLVRDACAKGALPQPGPGGKLVVLGLGKVCVEMLDGAREAGADIAEATLATFALTADAPHRSAHAHERIFVGGHPLPDAGSLAAGEALLQAAASLGPEDAVLLLVSGGGSALAEAPLLELTLHDLRALNQALLNSGAPIEELNCIRAHLSRLKGGGAARVLFNAGVRRSRALVLVDVPHGGAPAVSSGPFASDKTSWADALEIVRRRTIVLPERVRATLEAGLRGERPETLKPAEAEAGIEHTVLADMGSPGLVAQRLCARLDPAAEISRSPHVVQGSLEAVALHFEAQLPRSGPRLTLASGEVELQVSLGAPAGGRSQQLALRMARALRGRNAAFLAAGTDGRDGPTAAAGALVDGTTWDEALRRGLDPERALERCAATPLLEALSSTLPARRTGAHSGDLLVLWSE